MIILLMGLFELGIQYVLHSVICYLFPSFNWWLHFYWFGLCSFITIQWFIKIDIEPFLPALFSYPLPVVPTNKLVYFTAFPHGFYGEALLFHFFLSDPLAKLPIKPKNTPRFFVASELFSFPFISWLIIGRGGRPADYPILAQYSKEPRIIGILTGGAREIRIAHQNTESSVHIYHRTSLFNSLEKLGCQALCVGWLESAHDSGYGCKSIQPIQNFFQRLIGHSFPVLFFPSLPHLSYKLVVTYTETDIRSSTLSSTVYEQTNSIETPKFILLNCADDKTYDLPC